jgi:16S rRNA processing protein RimM
VSDSPPPAAEPPVVVGRVGKSHGLDGSFVVEDASETRELFSIGAKLLVDGEEATVVGSKQARGRPVIRLDRRVARGAALGVPRTALAPTADDEYYVFQLVGLEVSEQDGPVLGTVTDVAPGVANDVLELDSGLLLPMVEECLLSVDLETAKIVVAPGFRGAG